MAINTTKAPPIDSVTHSHVSDEPLLGLQIESLVLSHDCEHALMVIVSL